MSYVMTRRRGFGDAASDAALASRVGSIGTSVGTPAIAGALSSGGLILGMTPALAVPVIGAALAGVTLLVTKLIANSGCGPTCIQATEYANKSATLMQQNLAAYLALPIPRSKTAQAQALANFDALWQQLVTLCSDPNLGDAGKRCISERQPGGKYDDAKYNRDPIANDPNVVADSVAASASPGALLSGGPGLPLALIAGGALLLWAMS